MRDMLDSFVFGDQENMLDEVETLLVVTDGV